MFIVDGQVYRRAAIQHVGRVGFDTCTDNPYVEMIVGGCVHRHVVLASTASVPLEAVTRRAVEIRSEILQKLVVPPDMGDKADIEAHAEDIAHVREEIAQFFATDAGRALRDTVTQVAQRAGHKQVRRSGVLGDV